MIGKRIFIYIILFAPVVMSSCKEDKYVYPSVLTEFTDMATNSKGILSELITDNGMKYEIENRDGLGGLTQDTVYRTVSMYSLAEEKNHVTLYSTLSILSVIPKPADKFAEGIATDPLHVQSITYTGRYINMILLPMVKDKTHYYHFADNGISTNIDGTQTLEITLLHKQNGDYEGYKKKMYASVPVWTYNDILKDGDRIKLNVNTYDGLITKEFVYSKQP